MATTNETRWTPGPWEAEPFRSSAECFMIVDPGDAVVTHVVTGDHAGAFPAPVAAASARLIAAAPDLYEALIRLLREVVADEISGGAIEDARAALAKAEGRHG